MGHMAEQNRDRAARRRLYTPKCRSCGKPLRKYKLRWWSHMCDGPRPVVGCKAEYGIVQEVSPARADSPTERVLDYWCGEWGPGGNGYFCSVRCGYFWGVTELRNRGASGGRLRQCGQCHGPGPCLWDDAQQRYVCRSCHSTPDDDFFKKL